MSQAPAGHPPTVSALEYSLSIPTFARELDHVRTSSSLSPLRPYPRVELALRIDFALEAIERRFARRCSAFRPILGLSPRSERGLTGLRAIEAHVGTSGAT